MNFNRFCASKTIIQKVAQWKKKKSAPSNKNWIQIIRSLKQQTRFPIHTTIIAHICIFSTRKTNMSPFFYVSELITPTLDDEKPQPTALAVKTACILFSGPVFTFRAFKQSATRKLRGIAEAEFRDAIVSLENSGMGQIFSFRIPRTTNPVTVFVKNNPDSITWPCDLCSQTEFRQRYQLPTHRSVTPAIKRGLGSRGYVPSGFFSD